MDGYHIVYSEWGLGVKTFIIIPKKEDSRLPNCYARARMRVVAHAQILQTLAQFPFLKFNLK